MKRKIFKTQYYAKIFATEVNGTVKITDISDYMGVITVYVVEWKDDDETPVE